MRGALVVLLLLSSTVASAQITFSVDFQGPTPGLAGGFGFGLVTEGDILTTPVPGAPGPNAPAPGPFVVAPGIAIGAAVDRFPMRFLIMGMMVGQVIMFGLSPHLGDPVLYYVCLAGWGFSSGFYGPLTVAALPNFFGRTHLGAIQGVMMMVIVIASALGPALLAGGQALFGSYTPMLHALALLPLGIFVVAPFMRDPRHS